MGCGRGSTRYYFSEHLPSPLLGYVRPQSPESSTNLSSLLIEAPQHGVIWFAAAMGLMYLPNHLHTPAKTWTLSTALTKTRNPDPQPKILRSQTQTPKAQKSQNPLQPKPENKKALLLGSTQTLQSLTSSNAHMSKSLNS